MLRTIRRLLRQRESRHENMIRVPGRDGNPVYIDDRRMRQRSHFRGRPLLSEPSFEMLSAFISDAIGLRLGPENIRMIESRLLGRLRALDMGTFEEYLGYLSSKRGIESELDRLIDSVTTKKTHFYRQAEQFEFVMHKAAPELSKSTRKLRLWSAGCASGEEPYTLAMVLARSANQYGLFDYEVIGTDISSLALQRARQAEYDWGSLVNLPTHCREEFTRHAGGIYAIRDDLKRRVTFRRLNLIDDTYNLGGPVHIAFFRNVGIYFQAEDQHRILRRICDNIAPGGYLLLGHAESAEGFNLPLGKMEESVYRRV